MLLITACSSFMYLYTSTLRTLECCIYGEGAHNIMMATKAEEESNCPLFPIMLLHVAHRVLLNTVLPLARTN